MHGYDDFTSRCLAGAELTDSNYLKEAAHRFPSPPPLSWTKDYLKKQVLGSEKAANNVKSFVIYSMMLTFCFPLVERLSESGTTALGPAALLAIAMASRQPGSKVSFFIGFIPFIVLIIEITL